ncbi:MAG: ATP-dependent DNA helicase RecG [Pseudomonadales bacterium]|nr:ATP-dependent DNA helicase RecG [Pseudomonadales bacterium]
MLSSLLDLQHEAVSKLRGVGPALQQRLLQLSILTTADLVMHLPRDYQDRSVITRIADARPGMMVQLQARVTEVRQDQGRRRSLAVTVNDGSGFIILRFYHLTSRQLGLSPGPLLRIFYGEVRSGAGGFEIYHPEISDSSAQLPASYLPIYPITEGLNQLRLRSLIHQALKRMRADHPMESILHQLHTPSMALDLQQLRNFRHPLQQELIIEELAAHQISLLKLRMQTQQRKSLCLTSDPTTQQRMIEALGFTLTRAQTKVIGEILADLQTGHPMLRLIQGDVGSGKTAVAALVIAQALHAGWQVALMAPTDLLAEQHYQRLQPWLSPLGYATHFLSGRSRPRERLLLQDHLNQAAPCLVVGTHALFQDDVAYTRLGLVIIDEQHRFGVHQRLALRDKAMPGHEAHLLVMTATPIPRTLAMSAYGDLDTSIIDELPPGRRPITTVVLSQERRHDVIQRMEHHCLQGHQVYWVCTLIEESETLSAQAADVSVQELRDSLPTLRFGLIHGRMPSAEKQATMRAFALHELDVLVATTVIEVGVDVPNASLMVIENPERLGLAQLHQLRGRVGRGSIDSYCVLLYGTPLGTLARQRLSILRDSQDGFIIAEKDLELRGPGEVLGTRQAGLSRLHIADMERDGYLLPQAQQRAYQWLQQPEDEQQALLQLWLRESHHYARA